MSFSAAAAAAAAVATPIAPFSAAPAKAFFTLARSFFPRFITQPSTLRLLSIKVSFTSKSGSLTDGLWRLCRCCREEEVPSCVEMEALVRREERSLLCRCTIVKGPKVSSKYEHRLVAF